MNSKTKTGHEKSALADAVKTVMQKPKAPRAAAGAPAKLPVKPPVKAAAPAATAVKPAAARVAPKPAAKTAQAPAKVAAKPAAVVKAAPAPVKVATKPAAKPAAKPVKVEKPEKPKKTRLVRASYTIPEQEYEALSALKARAVRLGLAPKKSELLRAGIAVLSAMTDAALKTAVGKVEVIKTGRKRKAR